MAQAPRPSQVVTNPRIAKLIELEVSGRIKPEHQRELDTYRAQGLAPKKAAGSQTEFQGKSTGFYERAMGANEDFENTESASKPRGLIAETAAGAFPGVANKYSSADRQKAQQAKEDFVRASLRYESGAAIGPDEFTAQDRIFFPQPGDTPEAIEQKARARRRVIDSLKVASGPGATSVSNAAPTPASSREEQTPPIVGGNDVLPPPMDIPPNIGGSPSEGGAPLSQADITLAGVFGDQAHAAPDQVGVSTGDVRSEVDPELAGIRDQVARLVGTGTSAKVIRDYLSSAGVDPSKLTGIDELVAFRKAHPEYKGPYDIRIGVRDIPMSGMRSALAGAAASPVGAYGMTAADTILGGGLDEIAPGNTNLNRLGIDAVENANPRAALLGTVTGIGGNVATALGGEALLARGAARYAPRLAGLAAPIADTAFGATSGALSSNDDRLTGALLGGALGVGGGVLGRTVGRVIAPSGGKLNVLYDNGVRPTLGQRFVGTGLIGNAVNGTEELLQSFPGLGFMVKGARQKARDQFERGAFNSALGEIGQKLPDNVDLGTAPHGFMQKAFSDAYDNVLPNMRAVQDDDFKAATQSILDHVNTGGLSDDSASRFQKIIDAQVTRRFGDAGEMTGDQLKAATSNISKQVQNLRSSPQGDRELASVLEDYLGELKSSAMRNSDPGAAAALDAIDRGYAKAVRIEDAASARGGDTGRFTPQQFDRYVQKDSGGTRSRAYLRGDALFGDYAEAGKSLVDRIPNSGTADRMLMNQALGGAPTISALGYASPASAALVGAATLPYAPIARDAVAAAMAPRNNKLARTLGDLIRERGGAVGAPALVGGVGYLEGR